MAVSEVAWRTRGNEARQLRDGFTRPRDHDLLTLAREFQHVCEIGLGLFDGSGLRAG